MELPPADFLNSELERQHTTWRVRRVDGPNAETYEVGRPDPPTAKPPQVEGRRKAEILALTDSIADDIGPVRRAARHLNERTIFELETKGANEFSEKLTALMRQDKDGRAKFQAVLDKYRYEDIAELVGKPPSMEMPINQFQAFLAIFDGKPIPDYRGKVFSQVPRDNFTDAIERLDSWSDQALTKLDAKRKEYDR